MNTHYLITIVICAICIIIAAYLLWPSFVETFDGSYSLTNTNADGTHTNSAPYVDYNEFKNLFTDIRTASEYMIHTESDVSKYNKPEKFKEEETLNSSPESTPSLSSTPSPSPSPYIDVTESDTVGATNKVMALYKELLDRDPNGTELSGDVAAMNAGMLTTAALRQRIMDSVEYSNLIQMQSNSVNPRLSKIISDQNMMFRLADIYKEELGKTIHKYVILPIRDIYILLDYDDYALRAMFRDASYKKFENDVKSTPDLNKPQLLDIFNRYFVVTDLKKKGAAIARVEADKKKEPNGTTCATDRSIQYVDTDSSATISRAVDQANAVFDKEKAAKGLKKPTWPPGYSVDEGMASRLTEANTTLNYETTGNQTSVRIPIQNGNMVIIPGMAWSVPGYRPPVCTTAGQPLLIQPMMDNSKLLLGTPLDEAETQTSVGSIMPEFDYQAYVDVPQ